jgi:hypothetical protein
MEMDPTSKCHEPLENDFISCHWRAVFLYRIIQKSWSILQNSFAKVNECYLCYGCHCCVTYSVQLNLPSFHFKTLFPTFHSSSGKKKRKERLMNSQEWIKTFESYCILSKWLRHVGQSEQKSWFQHVIRIFHFRGKTIFMPLDPDHAL